MRNSLRHELMPVLKKYNPEICRELNFLASLARDVDGFISREAVEALNRISHAHGSGIDVCLDMAAFKLLPPPIKGKVIFLALNKVSGSETGFYSSHVTNIEALVSDGKSGLSINLPGGITA